MDDNLLQIDGNLNLTFKNAYSIGLSYRNKDALSFMGGVNLGTTTVGYAYDLGISKIKTYNDGTHEVFMSFKLKKIINLKPHGKIEIVFILIPPLKINLY